MLRIVLIEDSTEDAQNIYHTLLSLPACLSFSSSDFRHFADLQQGIRYVQEHPTDLLLLDLEFSLLDSTAIPFLKDIPNSIPILIVSHLNHYQHSSFQGYNIHGFVSKNRLSIDLPSAIQKIFQPRLSSPTEVFFPPASSSQVGCKFDISQIRYIDFHFRKVYTLHFSNQKCQSINSISFGSFCKQLEKDGIQNLRPISRNQIINTDHILSIKKDTHARPVITLLGYPDLPFTINDNYIKNIQEFL